MSVLTTKPLQVPSLYNEYSIRIKEQWWVNDENGSWYLPFAPSDALYTFFPPPPPSSVTQEAFPALHSDATGLHRWASFIFDFQLSESKGSHHRKQCQGIHSPLSVSARSPKADYRDSLFSMSPRSSTA